MSRNHSPYNDIPDALNGASREAAVSRPAPFAVSDILDEVAHKLASNISRRQAFLLIVRGLAGAAVTQMGFQPLWAAPTCLCNGQIYDPATACCTSAGVQTKNPMPSIAACPSRVAHPGYVAIPNGCGAEGSIFNPIIANSYGSASFLQSCNSHDICYGTCNDVKSSCDDTFLSSLTASCDAAYSGTGTLNSIKRSSCHGAANTYYAAVRSFVGVNAFESAQDAACDCCGTSTCPQACAGGTCASLPSCGNSGCVCFQTVEGTGFCHLPQSCGGLSTCTSSAGCPSGYACVSVTCCGSSSICIRPCVVIGPAPASLRSLRSGNGPILTTAGYQ